ncbi:MAG: TldD/PmbA family protein [Planctomycetota bacterium]
MLQDALSQALSKSTADYAEVRYETNDATGISFRGEEVDHVSTSKVSGGIVRACVKGGWGVVAFDSLEDLERRVREACACAALVGRERTQLAETKPVSAEVRARLARDFRGVPMDEKLSLTTRYNNIVLKASPKVETTHVGYSESFRTVHFASSRGAYFLEERPRVTLRLLAVARDGALVQQAWDGVASSETFDAVLGKEDLAENVAKRAADLLSAPACPGGRTTVVLDPELGGVFAHEAFGHLSEADFLYENPKVRDLMHLGREVGVKDLTIVDDGSLPGLGGTHAFDDEGTPTGRTELVRKGVLSGHLHSLETAAKMGAAPTGNARAAGRADPPIVRMTNTCIEPGKLRFDDLLAGIDRGVYARGMLGGQTMMEMFTFSAAYGYRIENGKIGPLVRDVVLAGNVFETLHRIDGIADDLVMIQKGGACGKGSQGIPVTFGSPHLRIRDVVVGGKH